MSRFIHTVQHAALLAVGLVLALAGGVLAAAGGNFILGVANNSGTAQTGLIANTTFPLHGLVVQQGGSGNGGYFISQGGSGMLGITKSGNRYAMSGTNDGAAGTGGAIIGMGKNNVALEALSNGKPPIKIVGPTNQPPMTVNSTVTVTNLGADRVDGYDANSINRTAFASTDNAPDGNGTKLSANITAPTRGWLHITASVDSWTTTPPEAFNCQLNVGASFVTGSARFVTFGTGNVEQDCVTQGSYQTCGGSHTVTLSASLVDANTLFGSGNLQVEFVPFNGQGLPVPLLTCLVIELDPPPAKQSVVGSEPAITDQD